MTCEPAPIFKHILSGLLWLRGITLLGIVRGELRPESHLTTNCFEFPRRNFDPGNSIEGGYGGTPHILIPEGGNAIDFALHDLQGNAWRLSDALQEKGLPVVMIWGMATCPRYQGAAAPDQVEKWAHWDEYELVEKYKDRATFVHLYGPEPHPMLPDTNFDVGTVWTSSWSVVRQPLTYQDRLNMVARIQNYTHPSQALLVDYLPGHPYGGDQVQPVWCSYVLGARSATVVSPGGQVILQMEWLDTDPVGNAIDEYWATKTTKVVDNGTL